MGRYESLAYSELMRNQPAPEQWSTTTVTTDDGTSDRSGIDPDARELFNNPTATPGYNDYEQQPSTDPAQVLSDTINNIIYQPQYAPGYPNWYGLNDLGLPAEPGAQPGVTWCNAAANAILVALGSDTRPLLDINPRTGAPDIGYTDANEIAQNAALAAANPLSGIVEVAPQLAQQLADKGSIVLAPAYNPAGHGHAGIVVPNAAGYNP